VSSNISRRGRRWSPAKHRSFEEALPRPGHDVDDERRRTWALSFRLLPSGTGSAKAALSHRSPPNCSGKARRLTLTDFRGERFTLEDARRGQLCSDPASSSLSLDFFLEVGDLPLPLLPPPRPVPVLPRAPSPPLVVIDPGLPPAPLIAISDLHS
jgi:hypothetical protein